MNKEQDLLLCYCGAFFVLIIVLLGIYFFILPENNDCVLWCIDNKGIETPCVFKCWNIDNINPIEKCRELQFNPVDYRVSELK